MAQGLQLFDADGNCKLDTSDYTFLIIGFGDTGLADGSISNTDISSNVKIIPYAKYPSSEIGSDYLQFALAQTPIFSVSDGLIKWTYTQPVGTGIYGYTAKWGIKFMYGVAK